MKVLLKTVTLLGIVVGIIAGLITVVGVVQGQPDLLGQYAVRINEILDLGVDLLRQCKEECFN